MSKTLEFSNIVLSYSKHIYEKICKKIIKILGDIRFYQREKKCVLPSGNFLKKVIRKEFRTLTSVERARFIVCFCFIYFEHHNNIQNFFFNLLFRVICINLKQVVYIIN